MASQVMTISRICVLLWFTIFFETVRTTTPSTFTDVDTSPYATESVTTPSIFTDADTSPYATDNATENVTMATDLPATTISNNTTENVTMATDLPATTVSNNTTENVTMATDLPATTISNNATENMTMATDLPATTITSLVFSNGLLAVCATQLKRLCSRKSPVDPEQQKKDARHKHNKDRISYYELGKLVRYACEEREDDKLKGAMKSLINDNYEIQKSKYGATDEDRYPLYQALCYWKKNCDDPRVDQIKLLFGECIAVAMVKSLRRLRDLRGRILDVPSSFSSDLKRILWFIGNKSKDNITKLLQNLNVENVDCHDSWGLQEIVDGALEKLEIWKEGLVPINPVVMFILALEDLKLNEGRDEHLREVESISWSLE